MASREKCPGCRSGFVVMRSGPYGAFEGCSRFPECRWSQSLPPMTEKKPSSNAQALGRWQAEMDRHDYSIFCYNPCEEGEFEYNDWEPS